MIWGHIFSCLLSINRLIKYTLRYNKEHIELLKKYGRPEIMWIRNVINQHAVFANKICWVINLVTWETYCAVTHLIYNFTGPHLHLGEHMILMCYMQNVSCSYWTMRVHNTIISVSNQRQLRQQILLIEL